MARPARARTVGGVEARRRAFWVVSVASSSERRERWVVKRAWGERRGLGDGIVEGRGVCCLRWNVDQV